MTEVALPSGLRWVWLKGRNAQGVHEIAIHSFLKPWSLEEFRSLLDHSQGWHFGIQGENAELHAYWMALLVDGCADILSLAVHPLARRKSLGSTLIERAQGSADIQRIALEVDVENEAAVRLYEKHGFSRDRIRKRYYDGTKDAWAMGWTKA